MCPRIKKIFGLTQKLVFCDLIPPQENLGKGELSLVMALPTSCLQKVMLL